MIEQIIFWLILSTFTIFLGVIVYFYGIQKSISDSYYTLKKNGIDTIWFSIGIASFAAPTFYLGESIWLPLAASFICFVSAAAAFKERKQTKIVHYVGAVGGILLGMVAIIVDHGQWELVVITAILSILIRIFVKNYFWWIEILSFITILLGIGIGKGII